MDLRAINRLVLANGAILEQVRDECDVCAHRHQAVEQASFTLSYKQRAIKLCDAHAEQVVYMNEDEEWRRQQTVEGIFNAVKEG